MARRRRAGRPQGGRQPGRRASLAVLGGRGSDGLGLPPVPARTLLRPSRHACSPFVTQALTFGRPQVRTNGDQDRWAVLRSRSATMPVDDDEVAGPRSVRGENEGSCFPPPASAVGASSSVAASPVWLRSPPAPARAGSPPHRAVRPTPGRCSSSSPGTPTRAGASRPWPRGTWRGWPTRAGSSPPTATSPPRRTPASASTTSARRWPCCGCAAVGTRRSAGWRSSS